MFCLGLNKSVFAGSVAGGQDERGVMGPKARKKKTRRQSGDSGAPAELPDAGALPTNKDVIAAVKHEVSKSEDMTNEDKEVEALINVKDAVLKK